MGKIVNRMSTALQKKCRPALCLLLTLFLVTASLPVPAQQNPKPAGPVPGARQSTGFSAAAVEPERRPGHVEAEAEQGWAAGGGDNPPAAKGRVRPLGTPNRRDMGYTLGNGRSSGPSLPKSKGMRILNPNLGLQCGE